jgi:hypothetical protein
MENENEDVTAKCIKEIVEYCDVLTVELQAYQQDSVNNMHVDPATLKRAEGKKECCFCGLKFLEKARRVRHHSHLPDENGLF